MSDFGCVATTIYRERYLHEGEELWPHVAKRVCRAVVDPYLPEIRADIEKAICERKFMPGGRYLANAGFEISQINNCFLFRAEDSREGWGNLFDKAGTSLMTGGGVGSDYSLLREENAPIRRMGGHSSGPISLACAVNEIGRHIKQGGHRRAALWGGLNWKHPDIFKWITIKDWPEYVREQKVKDYNFPATLDGTNISVLLDDEFFQAYDDPTHYWHGHAHKVYWTTLRNALKHGEPGFSIDVGKNAGETLRNACTEVTSADDCDMCNLGSINMARVRTIEEFTQLVDLATAFLICGTLYSFLPVQKMYRVREKNRRLGLGLMGLHEWLLKRGHTYGPNEELAKWMVRYRQSGPVANKWCDKLGISRPIATRAIAPNGTIGMVAETTTSAEPILSVAYKRYYLSRDGHKEVRKFQYVVDPTAHRLIQSGVHPDDIEDATTLSKDVGRRIEFQAWLQQYVDHGISSTINLPQWGSEYNNPDTAKAFGDTLMQHLPKLRGVTMYPDGARGGQPIVPVPYEEAVKFEGVVFDAAHESCPSGVCGD